MPPAPQERPDLQVFSTITAIDHLMRLSISRRLPPGMPYAHFELLRRTAMLPPPFVPGWKRTEQR